MPLPCLAQPLMMAGGYIVEPIPGQAAIAGYLDLHNMSSGSVRVVGFSSPAAGHVSLHRTDMEGGMMRMIEVDEMEIGAGSLLDMEPGGLHLMLMEPNLELLTGKQVEINLQWVDASGAMQQQIFSLPTRSIREQMMDHSGH